MDILSYFGRISSRSCRSSLLLASSFLIATALAFDSTSASAQLGVLDESKEIVKGSAPPQSTDPDKSFTIDSRNVVTEQNEPDKSTDMSEKAVRARETGTTILVDSALESGRIITLFSKGLGQIEKDLTANQATDLNTLTSYLESNDEIFEGLHKLSFKVEEFIPGDARIIFRQLIGDTPLELASYLSTDEAGNVIAVSIHAANPDFQEFDPKGWLSERVLIDLAEKVWAENAVQHPFKPDYKGFVISFDPEKRAFVPVYRLYVGAYEIKVNAITGETMSFMNTTSYEKRCTKTLSGIPPSGSDCTQKNSSNVSWYETFWNSSCIGSSPFCQNTKYNEVANEILNLRTWVNSQGSPQVSMTYDLRLNTLDSDHPGAGGWFHVQMPAHPVISIEQWTTSEPPLGPTDYVRKDIAGHEMGHLWHNRVNPNYSVIRVTPTGKAFAEAVADTVRAFQTDNYVQYTRGGERQLNPAVSLQWNNRVVSDGTYYNDSRVISNLFIDIREAIGKPKTVSSFIYIASFTNQSMDGDGVFTINDLKLAFTQCVGSACGLTSAQKSQVCSIWQSNGFPGAICPPPPPPKPAWISAVNTGNCGWGYSPTQGYFWGSIYYFNWSDVVGETYWQFCNSSAPFGPYSCTHTYGANTTTTLPNQWVVTGTWYGAVKACNSGGCGDLTGTAFHSTPNCSF